MVSLSQPSSGPPSGHPQASPKSEAARPSRPIQDLLSGEIKAPSPWMVDPFSWLLCDLGNPHPLWTSLGEFRAGGKQWPPKAPRCVF